MTLPGAALTMAQSGVVTVTFGCPRTTPGGSCRGVGALYGATGSLPSSIASTSRAKSKSAVRLASASFTVAAGKRQAIRLTLPKSVRRQVLAQRHLTAKLVLTSRDAAGQRKTQTLTVTIRLAGKR